jgi:hypothetical protein
MSFVKQAQSSELILWLLGLAVVLIIAFVAVEYVSRRWRYFWKIRHVQAQFLPKFEPPQRNSQAH